MKPSKLLKKLRRGRKIRLPRFIRHQGKRHGKAQILREDTAGGWSSPVIKRECAALIRFREARYTHLETLLEPLHREAGALLAEHATLAEKIPQPTAHSPGRQARLELADLTRQQALIARRQEIEIRLAELYELAAVVAPGIIEHQCREAEERVHRHLTQYWIGVLHTNPDQSLPLLPPVHIPENYARTRYLARHSALVQAMQAHLPVCSPDRAQQGEEEGTYDLAVFEAQ